MTTEATSQQNAATKEESHVPEGAERTTARAVFRPRVDIIENDQSIVLLVDMPGVDENSTDITLEKNVLTIRGTVQTPGPEGFRLAYAEYEIGDYERTFTMSEEIDQDKIDASVKDGVLRLTLPKSERMQAKKITVKAR
jgi:HSP20 family protein